MKESINLIIRGLYFGVGLSVMLVMFSMAYDAFKSDQHEREKKVVKSLQEKLIIDLVMSKYTEGGMVTHLRITNNSEEPAYGYIVETEFHDDKGIFIGECSSWRINVIEPGKGEDIEVFCEDRWPEWYKKVASTKAKFRNTSGSYTVTIKPD